MTDMDGLRAENMKELMNKQDENTKYRTMELKYKRVKK